MFRSTWKAKLGVTLIAVFLLSVLAVAPAAAWGGEGYGYSSRGNHEYRRSSYSYRYHQPAKKYYYSDYYRKPAKKYYYSYDYKPAKRHYSYSYCYHMPVEREYR